MPTMPRGDSKDMAWAAVRTALQQSGLHEGEVAETHVRMLVDALTRDIAARSDPMQTLCPTTGSPVSETYPDRTGLLVCSDPHAAKMAT